MACISNASGEVTHVRCIRMEPGEPDPTGPTVASIRGAVLARNGNLRDTCVYSILDCEWPTVKAHLTDRLKMSSILSAQPI